MESQESKYITTHFKSYNIETYTPKDQVIKKAIVALKTESGFSGYLNIDEDLLTSTNYITLLEDILKL